MRHPQLTTVSGLDDQCLTHYFIRVHGRAPSPEEVADLRGRGPTSSLEEQPLQPAPTRSPVTGAARRGVRREIAQLIHRL